ncbi:hypothetical protein ACO1O0_007117 [Amphichorda felina]
MTMLDMLKDKGSAAGEDYVIVDLRRTDYEGGTIRGSLNLPAQSLYPTLPALYSLFKAAKIRRVIWYCSSSRGRGTRAAGWFDDYLEDRKDEAMESLILVGGISGWARAGGEYVGWMDGYNADAWGGK